MDPTYSNLGDHTESIQINFVPTTVSYESLLDIFWASHDPTTGQSCNQYKAAIFYHDDEQRVLAEASKEEQIAIHGEVLTEILPLKTFYPAEDYHQKFYLRNNELLMSEFDSIYPDPLDFVNSTATARVNGVVGYYFTAEQLEAEFESFGLSEEAYEELLTYVQD